VLFLEGVNDKIKKTLSTKVKRALKLIDLG